MGINHYTSALASFGADGDTITSPDTNVVVSFDLSWKPTAQDGFPVSSHCLTKSEQVLAVCRGTALSRSVILLNAEKSIWKTANPLLISTLKSVILNSGVLSILSKSSHFSLYFKNVTLVPK